MSEEEIKQEEIQQTKTEDSGSVFLVIFTIFILLFVFYFLSIYFRYRSLKNSPIYDASGRMVGRTDLSGNISFIEFLITKLIEDSQSQKQKRGVKQFSPSPSNTTLTPNKTSLFTINLK